MHMADALLSPAVGGVMWAASAGTIAWCSRQLKQEIDNSKLPLMGVMGAFIFAAQMINFSIPATGSSGHLGGGLLLAILLGPGAAFMTMASVLTVQALFFADGGLLALGGNIFNLGFFPCFVAYPLVYKLITASGLNRSRLLIASIISAVIGLQLGSLGVVLQTTLSGITELSFASFALVMQPIHLAIGLVEGLATAGVVSFIWQARPELLNNAESPKKVNDAYSQGNNVSAKGLLIVLALAAVLLGGVLSWFASSNPDGLEWSIARLTGSEKLTAPEQGIHQDLARLQEKTALLPDYSLGTDSADQSARIGTSVAGLVGGILTLVIVLVIGLALKKRPGRQ